MHITLAYPYDGHAPDETIEVADETGRQMIYDGVARLPVHPDEDTIAAITQNLVETRTVAQLREAATDAGIDVPSNARRAELAAAVAAAQGTQITSTAPVTGTPNEENT